MHWLQESCRFEAAGCIGSSMIDTACLDTPKVEPQTLRLLGVYKACKAMRILHVQSHAFVQDLLMAV